MSSKMTEQSNPWVATSWEEFTYVCCPECVFKSHEKTSFYAHAIQNHPKSEAFFESEFKNNLFEQNFEDDHVSHDFLDPWDIKIEPEDSKRLLEAKSEYSLDHPDYEFDTKPSIDSLVDSKNSVTKGQKVKSANGIKKFSCTICNQQFGHSPSLRRHMKTHLKSNAENIKTFKCSVCPKVFHKRDDYRLHRKNEHNTYLMSDVHKCTFCTKEIKGIIELWNHNKEEHNSPYVKCEECDKIFENPKSMYAHKKTHIVIPCEFCGKSISSVTMKSHVDTMHSGDDKSVPSFICEHCPFVTTRKKYLYQHKKNSKCQEKFDENTQSYIGYTCQICNEIFSPSKYAENSYLKHYKSMHVSLPPEFENKEQFLCQQCPETFFSTSKLNVHFSRKHGTGRKALKEYVCKKCDFTCIGPRIYAAHMFEVHGKVVSKFEIIKCSTCEQTFRAASFYIQHHQEVHGSLPREYMDKQLFMCDQCSFVSIAKRSLDAHLVAVHKSGDPKKWKPVNAKCSYCEKVFKNRGNLKEHILTKHENRRDHHCDECQRSFGTPGFLKTHKLNVHNRVRCEECGKEHYNAFELKRHKATVHGIKPKGIVHQCKHCPLFFKAQKSLEKHVASKHLCLF